MTISDIRKNIVATVRALTPTLSPDWPYVCREDGTGSIGQGDLDLRQPDTETRHFVVWYSEYPSPTLSACYQQTVLMLSIAYRADQDWTAREDMIAEDIALFTAAFRDPAAWPDAKTFMAFGPSVPEDIEDADGHPALKIIHTPYAVQHV